MRGSRDLEVPCVNPDCDEITFVHVFGDTLEEPGYPNNDTCAACGDNLDFENADPAEPPEPDYDSILEDSWMEEPDRGHH